ncbi:hypothetical protein [Methylobacterium bullatum]|nr:hypothetical protein [Methylobacterium bullatum]
MRFDETSTIPFSDLSHLRARMALYSQDGTKGHLRPGDSSWMP